MAKVGVRIEGKETLSPAAASAAKSLRQLREETEFLKKGAQNILQPLINLRSMLVSVAGAAGIVQAFRMVVREIGQAVDAFAKIDEGFAKTAKGLADARQAFKAEVGGIIADVAGPLMGVVTNLLGGIADAMREARNLKQAIKDVARGAVGDDMAVLDDQLSSVLKRMIEIIKMQDKGLIRPNMREYYDEELQKLNQVRLSLLAQKELIREIAEIHALVARISGTAAMAKELADQQDAAVEAVRALIRGESTLGRVLALETRLATLRAWSFENEERYEEARLEAIETLQAELDKLTGRVKEIAYSFDPTAHIPNYYPTIEAIEGGPHAPDEYYDPYTFDPTAHIPNYYPTIEAIEGGPYAPDKAEAGALAGILGQVGSAFLEMLGSITSIQLLMDPIGTALEATLGIIGPLIDSALAPLVGILVVLGQLLGTLLVPVIEALTPIIEIVGQAFVWLYNNILRPVGLMVYKIFTGIGNMAKVFINAIISVLQFLGFAEGVKKFEMATVDPSVLPEISYDDLLTAGGTAITNAGGGSYSSGSRTTVEYQPDIYVTIVIEGSVYGAGGPKKVGEEMARALEAYAGIGGRIHIEGALT